MMKNIWNDGKIYDESAKRIQLLNSNILADLFRRYSTENQTVLEMGCGTGYLTENLSKLNNIEKIIAVDSSPDMINLASKKNIKNTSFINIPFEKFKSNEKFDCFVSNASFHWLYPNYDSAISKISSLLKKDGMVFIATAGKNRDSKEYDMLIYKIFMDIDPSYETFSQRRLSPHDIHRIFLNNSFALEDTFLISRQVLCTPMDYVSWVFASGSSWSREITQTLKEEIALKLEKNNFSEISHWSTFFILRKI